MAKNVVSVSPDETLSSALTKMKKYRVHQLPVIDGNNMKGMLLLKKIMTKDIDAAKARVSSFMTSTSIIGSNETAEKAAEFLLQSGQRALPVIEKEKVIGIISETDLIRNIDTDITVEKIMTKCSCVEKKDDIGKVKKIMNYENISRVPIVDNSKVVGIIGMLDLIDIALGKQAYGAKGMGGKAYGEPISMNRMTVETVMKKPIIIEKTKKISEIAGLLGKNEEVLIENGDVYIISPKDILELASRPKKTAYVQITNLGEEDDFVAGKIWQAAEEFVKKIGKFLEPQSLVIHIDRIHKHENKAHYFIRARILTPFGLFVSKADGWELPTATQEALNKLEREIIKKHGKISHHEAEKKSKMMRRR